MKFVCRSCETFMTYTEQEKISDGSLGITFTCPQCGHRFSMVTNPGETQMVYALGVKVGGRDAPTEPLEMTRQSLKSESVNRESIPDSGSAGKCDAKEAGRTRSAMEGSGGCPFPQMPAKDGAVPRPTGRPRGEAVEGGVLAGAPPQAKPAETRTPLAWTTDAELRLERIPLFIRPLVQQEIERVARQRGVALITEELLQEVREQMSPK